MGKSMPPRPVSDFLIRTVLEPELVVRAPGPLVVVVVDLAACDEEAEETCRFVLPAIDVGIIDGAGTETEGPSAVGPAGVDVVIVTAPTAVDDSDDCCAAAEAETVVGMSEAGTSPANDGSAILVVPPLTVGSPVMAVVVVLASAPFTSHPTPPFLAWSLVTGDEISGTLSEPAASVSLECSILMAEGSRTSIAADPFTCGAVAVLLLLLFDCKMLLMSCVVLIDDEMDDELTMAFAV